MNHIAVHELSVPNGSWVVFMIHEGKPYMFEDDINFPSDGLLGQLRLVLS